MKTRNVLYADAGMILTDGEIFGKVIYLGDDKDKADFYSITLEEYERIMAQEGGDARD